MTPGWRGCRECHRLLATRARADGRYTYVGMEQNVVPTLRYDPQTIRDALHVVRTGMAPLVHLSCLPIPGGLRYHVHGTVMGKLVSRQELSQCMVLSDGVIEDALRLDVPIDVALSRLGYMKHVTYPTPFQRNLEPSLATPDFNRAGLRVLRQLAFHPVTYRNLEVLAQHDVAFFGAVLLTVAGLVVALVCLVRNTGRNGGGQVLR